MTALQSRGLLSAAFDNSQHIGKSAHGGVNHLVSDQSGLGELGKWLKGRVMPLPATAVKE